MGIQRTTPAAPRTVQPHPQKGTPPRPDRAADPLRLITFNTAVGNPKIRTHQRDFLELPFYREVLEGAPGAPILGLQEVGPAQHEAVKRAAANGRFKVVYVDRYGMGNSQGNMMLIPGRFEVLSSGSHRFVESHLKGTAASLWSWAKSGFKGPLRTQLIEPRMWNEVKLRDSQSGQVFSVFNTHLSLDPHVRLQQAHELVGRLKEARKAGPVVLMGDLNTRAPGYTTGRPDQDRADAAIRKLFFPFLQDMGAGVAPGKRPDIDFVLADGFDRVSTRMYTGDSLSVPSAKDAEALSDHYAEENVVRFS